MQVEHRHRPQVNRRNLRNMNRFDREKKNVSAMRTKKAIITVQINDAQVDTITSQLKWQKTKTKRWKLHIQIDNQFILEISVNNSKRLNHIL